MHITRALEVPQEGVEQGDGEVTGDLHCGASCLMTLHILEMMPAILPNTHHSCPVIAKPHAHKYMNRVIGESEAALVDGHPDVRPYRIDKLQVCVRRVTHLLPLALRMEGRSRFPCHIC